MESSSSWHYPNLKPNSFLFNYNFEPFPAGTNAVHHQLERIGECDVIGGGEKKKRLTSEQLELLENSFQEEIKLDPERKMRLSRDLRLHPRQVAVWFQNRRARWKAKQLERLYDSLKRDFDAVTREKHALQDEVMKLRAMLMEQATRINTLNNHKQVSIGCTENISGGDETVESTSPAAGAQQSGRISPVHSIGVECHYNMFSAGDYNSTVASPPYWPPLPSSNYPC